MSDDILSLDLKEISFLTYPTFENFDVFNEDLNSLYEYVDAELVLERMEDSKQTLAGKIRSIEGPLKSTRDTTKDVVKAYGTVTDAGGTFLKSVWDLVMKAVHLAAKVIKYVLGNLAKVPKAIADVAKAFVNIPSEIKRKVRGDIHLYITVDDLNNLHKIIIPQIDSFLENSYEMSKGDAWGTFFHRRGIGEGTITKFILTENDMKYYKKMRAAYNRIQMINFSKSLVKISDQNVIDIYFSDAKSITYKNADRGDVQSTYYDALIEVFEIFRYQKDYMTGLSQDFNQKLDITKMNQTFQKVSESTQRNIADAIQMNAKIINIIGNLMRYTISDMDTLRGVANKLLKEAKVTRAKA